MVIHSETLSLAAVPRLGAHQSFTFVLLLLLLVVVVVTRVVTHFEFLAQLNNLIVFFLGIFRVFF